MFISFVWGVFVRGVFGKGGFCPGGFCPGVYVRGVFVGGGFVLIPKSKDNVCKLNKKSRLELGCVMMTLKSKSKVCGSKKQAEWS